MSLWRRVLAERRSVVLPIAILLVANIGVMALGVFPLKRAVVSAQNSALESGKNLVDAQRKLKAARDQKTSKDRADIELKKFYSEILPADLNGPQGAVTLASFWLQHVAAESGMQFKTASGFTQEQVKGSPLIRYSGQVVVSGDYPNFRKFLYIAETSQEFLIIERVDVSQPALAQGGALDITLSVSTYFRGAAGSVTK
jgi:hypothetical protein